MTAAEWLACDEPFSMYDAVIGTASHRKLILLSVACLPFEDMDANDWEFVERVAEKVEGVARLVCLYGAFAFTEFAPSAGWWARRAIARSDATRATLRANANHIRDIFGNPFHPVSFSPGWRTDTALSLARRMYESREFGAMPILADALQDAGCDHEALLSHCREPRQVHVRGCWAVDLVLGKG